MQDDEVARALGQAMQAQRGGRPAEAERLFRAIVAQREQPVALNALGVAALAQGVPADAAPLFERAIRADPASPELWMNLAKAHRERRDDAGEERALDGALAIDRRHFMALVRMAELMERSARPVRAGECWAGVLAMAGALPERTPALDALFEHARDFVAGQRADMAGTVDAGLAAARAALDPGVRRRVDAAIDHTLGRRAIFANRCAGLHVPFLPADEFFDRALFPWLAGFEAQAPVIRAELAALLAAEDAGFHPYVEMERGTPANEWTALDHQPAWSALHLWRHGGRIDAACARAPRTAAIVAALPLIRLAGRTPTVFFSVLAPGTRLPAHTGVSNVRAIIHLPLIVPDRCALRVGGETRAWREGEALAFDDTIEHEAWNLSDKPRGILILDVWNPHLTEAERALLERFAEVMPADAREGAVGEG